MWIVISFFLFLIVGEIFFRTGRAEIEATGDNAMWLRHQWVEEARTEEQYRELAGMLKEMRIKDAYFHAGPLEGDGTVPVEKYAHAEDLLAFLKKEAPEVRVSAWLGQVEARAGGTLDLAQEDVREQIVRTSETFLELGFDGIHYDVEPIYSGDEHFVELLKETRKVTREKGKVLSVATSKPEPVPGIEAVVETFADFPGFWTQDYFKEVAAEVDQVAIMAYDTALPVPFLYGWLMEWTVEWSAEQEFAQQIYVGVPTYEEVLIGHYPYVENLEVALRGVRNGMEDLKKEPKLGVAVYAEWTTDEEERETFKRLWTGE